MKASEADGWARARDNSCCPGDDWADGYNKAIKDITKLVKKSCSPPEAMAKKK